MIVNSLKENINNGRVHIKINHTGNKAQSPYLVPDKNTFKKHLNDRNISNDFMQENIKYCRSFSDNVMLSIRNKIMFFRNISALFVLYIYIYMCAKKDP